jgi:hypothetical protein
VLSGRSSPLPLTFPPSTTHPIVDVDLDLVVDFDGDGVVDVGVPTSGITASS